MYIPWGRTTVYRVVGRVADFCPICRDFRPFVLAEARSTRHFYHAPYGAAEVAGFVRTCETCGHESDADPATYRAPSRDPDLDADALILATNPDARRNWAARLMLEDRVRSRKLNPGERTALLREPFDWANRAVGRRSARGQLDRPTAAGCLLTFLIPVACLMFLPLTWKASREAIEAAAVVAGGACLAITFLAIITDAGRYYRRAIRPGLVDAIRPLEPSAEEVDEILGSIRGEKGPLVEVASARDIHRRASDPWG